MIATRDELIQALKDAGMPWERVYIDGPTTLNAGTIEEVRDGQDDEGHFIVLQVSADG
jgi:hypothetical protein